MTGDSCPISQLAIAYPTGYNRIREYDHPHGRIRRVVSPLRDSRGKARIISRLDAAALGNFGDCEPVGEGVSEMRVHTGPGYRLYFTRRGRVVYVLLLAGDKSTQRRDIKRAIQMARELELSDE